MKFLDKLIETDILEVAYELFKKKCTFQDEKKAFISIHNEAIQIHIYRLKDEISHSDIEAVAKELFIVLTNPQQTQEERVLDSVCLSFRHDFGLLSEEERNRIRFQAKEWLYAWRKHLDT